MSPTTEPIVRDSGPANSRFGHFSCWRRRINGKTIIDCGWHAKESQDHYASTHSLWHPTYVGTTIRLSCSNKVHRWRGNVSERKTLPYGRGSERFT